MAKPAIILVHGSGAEPRTGVKGRGKERQIHSRAQAVREGKTEQFHRPRMIRGDACRPGD